MIRVLALIGDYPDPPISGVRVRNYYLWPALVRLGVELKVLGTHPPTEPWPTGTFGGLDAEFCGFKREPLPIRVPKGLTRSYHQFPSSADLARRVDEVAGAWRPDVIHAEELRSAQYLPALRGRKVDARQSVTIHNVESDLYARIASPAVPVGKKLVTQLHLRSLRALEARLAARLDLCLAYSETDRERYEALYPGTRWSSTRGGTDALGLTPGPQPADPSILLVGNWSYAPNRRGLDWFLDGVLPRLEPRPPITVAGSGADAGQVAKLAALKIRFVDTPRDLTPLYDQHAVVAVPVLEGSGTRGKIIEALAHERFTVTTTKGPEGLDLRPGEGFVIADEPAEFARRLVDALAAPAARAASARRGREAVIARYDWSVVAAELLQAWEHCVAR